MKKIRQLFILAFVLLYAHAVFANTTFVWNQSSQTGVGYRLYEKQGDIYTLVADVGDVTTYTLIQVDEQMHTYVLTTYWLAEPTIESVYSSSAITPPIPPAGFNVIITIIVNP